MVESNLEPYNDILQKVQFFYKFLKLDTHEKHKRMFDLPCTYKTLVVNMNPYATHAALILLTLVKMNRIFEHPIKHTDSTDIPVCSNRKANSHKTMGDLSSGGHPLLQ